MFNKLLSNLPFNPSLINQVAFYSKRLKRESSVRRLGFVLVALTMVVQLFAVLSPAQPSLAASGNGNDLIPGGVHSKDELVQHCVRNDWGYQAILAHYAISCSNVQNNSAVTTIRANQPGWNGQPLYSMGHNSLGPINGNTGKATDEIRVDIAGVGPVYVRLLGSWDRGAPSTYTALSVGNFFGVQFFLLFNCGNLVQAGKPAPPPPPPAPPPPPPAPTPKPQPKPIPKPCEASKNTADVASCIKISKRSTNTTQNISHANNSTANPGDIIKYALVTKNTAIVPYKGYVVREDLRDVLEYADIVNMGAAQDNDGILTWSPTDIGAGESITYSFTVKVKDPVPKTPEPCSPEVVHPCPSTGSFDLLMTNVYGNTVNIKIKPPVEKTVEITTTKVLTNTGPGTSLIIGFSVTAMVGYFFARSRLMAKELDFVRSEYNSGGI